MDRAHRSFAVVSFFCLAALSVSQNGAGPNIEEAYVHPPKAIADLVLAPRHTSVALTNLSPDRTRFLVSVSTGLPALAKVSKPYLNLGGEQIDTEANRDRALNYRNSAGFRVYEWQTGKWTDTPAPSGTRVTGGEWSCDGGQFAFIAHHDKASMIYIADPKTGKSRRLSASPLLLTLSNGVQWTADGKRIIAVLVPNHRMDAPVVPVEPRQPLVRYTEATKNRHRTYRGLLENTYSQEQLEYFTTGQLAIFDVATGKHTKIGKPAMIRSFSASTDGKFYRVTTTIKPFSYFVPASSFGTQEEMWDETGKVMFEIDKREMRFGDATPPAPKPDAKRSLSWRPDGQGMSFLQQEPEPPKKEAEGGEDGEQGRGGRGGAGQGGAGGGLPPGRKDRVMQWLPPFGKDDTKVVYESDTRIGSVRYSADMKTLFLTETRSGNEVLFAVRLDDPKTKHTISSFRSDDFYKNPGSLMMTTNALGMAVVRMSKEGDTVYLEGTQYFEDPEKNAPRPFIDAVPIGKGEKARIWQSSPQLYETAGAVLDVHGLNSFIVAQQGPTQPTNYYLTDLATKQTRKLTENKDHTPEVTKTRRERVLVTRPDGFKFWVKVTLPTNFKEGDKPPAMFWFYPREFVDQKAYDQGLRTYNKNTFPTTGAMTMSCLTVLGYAVVEPDAPIVGPTGRMNDAYVPDLRNNLSAVIDELDRLGYIDRRRLAAGGHSYGAFSTANAMVHTPFFKAGIAGDGAYNRTLTPMAFQSETRVLWEARETYLAMSPMLFAEQMTGALLMYHGMDDQNVGTDPINSIRMFHALQGLGKTAALYMYPYEDHSPAAKETYLDLWARWTAWLDKYVKNAK